MSSGSPTGSTAGQVAPSPLVPGAHRNHSWAGCLLPGSTAGVQPRASGRGLIGKVENLGLITETQIVVVEGGHSPDHSSNVLLSPVSLNSVFLTPKIAPAYISVYPCRGTRDTAGKLVTLY